MQKRPNILFITSDQHRGDTLGCMGHPCVRTPHLDMLCPQGVLFRQAHSDCPVCIPTRTTMITGIQAHRYGMPSYNARHRIERARELFLGSLMTRAGYQTCLVGKRHWHTEPSFRAGFEQVVTTRGWERARAAATGGRPGTTGVGANEFAPTLSQLPPELCLTNWLVDRSIEFLEEREQAQPFFLWTSFIDPHPPSVIHEPYYSMYDDEDVPEPVHPEWAKDETCPYAGRKIRIGNAHAHLRPKALRKARGVYYGQITNMDHQIGRLVGALMRLGLWEDTVIVYASDHGEHLGDYGTFFKGTFLEPATHIPLLFRLPDWFGAERGRVSDALVEPADLLPTFCELAGALVPEDVTGRSLLPLLRGETDRVRDAMHGQIDGQHMFHDGRYKYLYFADDGAELLFDKANDPLDERNLAGDQNLVRPIRERFIEHLRSEKHEHLVEGKLVNLHRRIEPEDLTNVVGWMGLSASSR